LSPDKRTILIHSEDNLIEALKSSLEALFAPARSTYSLTQAKTNPVIGLTQPTQSRPRPPPLLDDQPDGDMQIDEPTKRGPPSPSPASEDIDLDESPRKPTPVVISDSEELAPPSLPPAPPRKSTSVAVCMEPRQLTLDTEGATWALRQTGEHQPPPKKKRKVEGAESKRAVFSQVVKSFAVGGPGESAEVSKESDEDEAVLDDDVDGREAERPEESRLFFSEDEDDDDSASTQERLAPPELIPATLGQHRKPLSPPPSRPRPSMPEDDESSQSASLIIDDEPTPDVDRHLRQLADEGVDAVTDAALLDYILPTSEVSLVRSLAFDVDAVRALYTRPPPASPSKVARDDEVLTLEAELAGLAVEDAEAEAALSRIFAQGDFATMTVCGQFNLGCVAHAILPLCHADPLARSFIVARGKGAKHDDLWILDQHASDEKRNFEERTSRLRYVRANVMSPSLQCSRRPSSRASGSSCALALLGVEDTFPRGSYASHSPRQLDLPAADELLVMDNLDVLKSNGFDVDFDETRPAGSRIRLVAHPTSKSTVFGIPGACGPVLSRRGQANGSPQTSKS
jgi:DNA mismatch repair protein PMS2